MHMHLRIYVDNSRLQAAAHYTAMLGANPFDALYAVDFQR